MRFSAKADYALRASLELATGTDAHVKAEVVARAQSIPLRFLEQILLDLKHAGLVQSQRGADGGYWLAKAPGEISVADVIRAVEGPIAMTSCVETGKHDCVLESCCQVRPHILCSRAMVFNNKYRSHIGELPQ